MLQIIDRLAFRLSHVFFFLFVGQRYLSFIYPRGGTSVDHPNSPQLPPQEDSQENSHPVVQQHNGDISSILQSFDVITYCKGASVLRMLYHCVGSARFLEGTRRFVVDHQYSCATQEDLWKAVQVKSQKVIILARWGCVIGASFFLRDLSISG